MFRARQSAIATHFDNCVQSRKFLLHFIHTNRNELYGKISDLQIFIIQLHCITNKQTKYVHSYLFEPYIRHADLFRPHWKFFSSKKRFISRAEQFPISVQLRVCMTLSFLWTHSWTCIYIILSLYVSRNAHPILYIFVYFVTIWYYQVFTLESATYNSFWVGKKCANNFDTAICNARDRKPSGFLMATKRKIKYFKCEVGTTIETTTVTKNTSKQTHRMEESIVCREIERYRQHWLAKSLFSTLLLFSLFFIGDCCCYTKTKRMLQSIHKHDDGTIHKFCCYLRFYVMHSSVCTLVGVLTTWMRDKRDLQ